MLTQRGFPHFVEDRAQLDALLSELTLVSCPHCGAHDTLIGHGFLRGYAESDSEVVVRGRRLFCSNRGRKRGCGRTVAVLLAWRLFAFCLGAETLWRLFSGLAAGFSVERAAQTAHWLLCVRSAYRIAERVRRRVPTWRSWLAAKSAPPSCAAKVPLAQLRQHFCDVLGQHAFCRWQFETNTSVL